MDVLIVEDEEALRESLIDGLSQAFRGSSIRGVASAEEAEPLLESDPPKVVVSDIRLPGKDGVGLLLSVRGRRPSARFIFISAYPFPESQQHAFTSGIEFLRKPFEFGDLVEAVGSALEGEQFSGELGGVSLVDLLQVLNMGRRTAAVTVKRRGRSGHIHLSQGEIVHARVGDLSGLEAFNHLMTWKGGTFASQPGREPPAVTIREPFHSILLDAFRLQDEEEEEGDGEACDPAGAWFASGDEGDSRAAEGGRGEPPHALVEEAAGHVPGCLIAACADLDAGILVGLAASEALPQEMERQLPIATAALFAPDSLLELDRLLADGAAAAPQIREVIALSDGRIHFLQRHPLEPHRVFVAVCRAKANLGTVVARARGWLRRAGRTARRA